MTHESNDSSADVLDMLRRYQPTPELGTEWVESDPELVLHRILDVPLPPRVQRSRSRWVGPSLVAAAAVLLVVSIGLPSNAPGGPAPAAALDRLAVIAAATGPVLGPDQYLRVRAVTDVPYVSDLPIAPGQVRDGNRLRSIEETWSGRNEVSLRSTDADDRPCLDVVPLRGQVATGNYDTASARQLATLPTDAENLARYIDDHPDGGNRGTINRFAAVTDLLWSGIASPQLRSAALNVLAQTPGLNVDENTSDDRGRPAIRVDDNHGDDNESVWFDAATAQISERAGATEGGVGSTTVTSSAVVGQLPALTSCL